MTKKLPPGPRGPHQIFQLVQSRKKNVLGLMDKLFKDFGDVLYFRIGRSKIVVINDPNYAQMILQTKAKHFSKGIGYNRFKMLIGEGLITSDGKLWRKQRQLCAPAFSRHSIEKNFPSIHRMIDELIAEWKEKLKDQKEIELDIAEEMNHLALSLITEIIFGSKKKKEIESVKDSFTDAMKFLDISGKVWIRLIMNNITIKGKPLLTHWEQYFPSEQTKGFRQALQKLNKLVESLLEEKSIPENQGDDLLSRLITARDENGEAMERTMIRDEVMTLLLAGHETTALALTWTWYLLGRHPEERKKMEEEVLRVIPKGTQLDFQKMSELSYTKKVFEEALRMHPTVWRVSRRSIEEVEIGDYTIPKHTDIIISTYSMQRHPKFWENPDKFQPERMDDAKKKERHAFSYIPFGAGPRVCIGELFAYTESISTLALLSREFEIIPVSTELATPDLGITMRIKGGYKVKVRLKGNQN